MRKVDAKYNDNLSFSDIVSIARKFDFSRVLTEKAKTIGGTPYLCRWYMDGEEYSPKSLTYRTLTKIKDLNSLTFVFSLGNKEEEIPASYFDDIKKYMI